MVKYQSMTGKVIILKSLPINHILRKVTFYFLSVSLSSRDPTAPSLPRKPGVQKLLKKKSSSKCNKMEVDVLSSAALEKLYYISHNAPDCLEYRGFGWPNSQKKKGTKQKKEQIRSAKH
ncbi:small lysine-rich protein 1 [Xiphophorus couchianus]|uniref:small lysine-rich protein 1 n=1 Tax=Xiphophorus couchianus TaxID=32473 RepID=UPI0010165805|nr:small lysine-rich protein 1 [Xiphophorus couchianus]